jgi:Zn-dependent peptidase ImmA (M78 family)
LRRGFKAWAETESQRQRQYLGLLARDRLPANLLANFMGITILTIHDIPDIPTKILNQLTIKDTQSWSAFTISSEVGHVIIHNIVHTLGRQESNLMHEMAHLICQHHPGGLVHITNIPYPLRSFNKEQEEEASWLGSCLQLPRSCLLWAVQTGMNDTAIANYYVASLKLVRYRRQITGINHQLSKTLNSKKTWIK